MEYTALTYRAQDGVAVITTNRPHVLNAQSRVMIEELTAAFDRAAADEAVRVIVVAGAGEHFSSGHDLGSAEELEDRQSRPLPRDLYGHYQRAFELYLDATLRWRDVPKPTIAMVQGYCIMGGLMLATACDLIVCSEDARFADRAARWGGPHVQYNSLPWEVGGRKAKEYLFTGDWITAQEALRLDLVNRVVPRERLEEETMDLAGRIALQDPFALRMAKVSVNQALDLMGQRNALAAAFQTYMLSTVRRQGQLSEGDDDWRDRVRRRDEPFGDQR